MWGFLPLLIILSVFVVYANWHLFIKMNRKGWESLIPIYHHYVLFDVLYDEGYKVFFLLIPIYNIYLIILLYLDLADQFDKSTGFGLGLLLLYPFFISPLALGNSKFVGRRIKESGAIAEKKVEEVKGKNIKTSITNQIKSLKENKESNDPILQIQRLNELRNMGAITNDEYDAKKKELLAKIK